jgi:thiosulfate/3-mercaptopyruvate sulfurtransferase
MTPDLVTTGWLQDHLDDRLVRVVDCRWVLGKPGEGRRQYEQGHIPGGVHLDVEEHLSGKEGPGRHPIPSKRDFQKAISEIGVGRETHVVAYDDGRGTPAARLWWLLRYYGHEKVSVLDGGWELWRKENRPVDQAVPHYSAAEFLVRPKKKWVVDKAAVDSLRDQPDVLLMDARMPERYRGEVEPIDPKAGHIPGAQNFPFPNVIDPEMGKFLPKERLKAEFEKIGTKEARTIICYCGSGVTACTNILALKLAGYNALLYEGSWSEWCQDPTLPIAAAKP